MNKLRNLTIVIAAIAMGSTASAASERLFVPMGGENSVLVVDAGKNAVVDRFGDIPNTHGLAMAAGYLVAGEYAEREKGAAPAKPEEMTQDEHAAHHAGATPKTDAVEQSISFLTLFRPDDGAIVQRIEVPGAVHHVAITPDSKFAIATHPNGGGVSIVDLQKRAFVMKLATGEFPNYVVATRNSGKIFVSNAGDDTISEIAVGDWRVERKISVGSSPEHMILSPDEEYLYVNNVDGGSVSVVSIEAGEVVQTHQIGGALHGIDLSGDGETLFVSATERDQVLALDAASGRVLAEYNMPSPYHLVSAQDAGTLYVTSIDVPEIWVFGQTDLSLQGRIEIGGKGHQLVLERR